MSNSCHFVWFDVTWRTAFADLTSDSEDWHTSRVMKAARNEAVRPNPESQSHKSPADAELDTTALMDDGRKHGLTTGGQRLHLISCGRHAWSSCEVCPAIFPLDQDNISWKGIKLSEIVPAYFQILLAFPAAQWEAETEHESIYTVLLDM